jgi:hypothetical protein
MCAFARTAAKVVVALAAAAAAGCSASNAPQASSSAPTAVTSGSPADGGGQLPSLVPRDYVTIDPANEARLIVRATATGTVVATVGTPRGSTAAAVYGSGNGQVFAVATTPVARNPGGGQVYYLLRLRSGTPAPLQRLSVGHAVGPGPAAVALSPDGSKIAMAFTYRTSPPSPQPLVLYSTATGAVLRTWTVSSGIISAADPMAGGDLGQEAGGLALRWTADGRGLAFAFHADAAPGKQGYGYARAASIRLLEVAAPGGDLIGSSRELLVALPGYGYNPGNGIGEQCLVSHGWSVPAGGLGFSCAAEFTVPGRQGPGAVGSAACPGRAAAGPAKQQRVSLGFYRQFRLPDGSGEESTIFGICPAATAGDIQLAWGSPNGAMVLGNLDSLGHVMFGLFTSGSFRALPPPPAGIPLASIAW